MRSGLIFLELLSAMSGHPRKLGSVGLKSQRSVHFRQTPSVSVQCILASPMNYPRANLGTQTVAGMLDRSSHVKLYPGCND